MMSFSLSQLFFLVVTYLLLLFGAAYITDRGWLPRKLVHHPITYVLSLCTYAGAWTFYGAIGLAHDYGYSFLATYFGASAAFILAPIMMMPLLRLARTYQLSSIADLFAFRFRSQQVGTIVTLLMIIAALPLISIQIQAVTDTLNLILDEDVATEIAFLFCAVIAVFAVLFGARHPSMRQKHEGLVVAMAVQSLIKLLAIGAIGAYCLLVIFGGNAGLEEWLAENRLVLSFRYSPVEDEAWRTLLLAFFTSAILMPHMFHMLFTENLSSKGLSIASWGVPLFLLLMAIAIPPILWAGIKLALPSSPLYYSLAVGIQQESQLLTSIALIGGLSAGSGTIIVTAIALSGMVINHLFLPLYENHDSDHLYHRLIWARRAAIVAITLLGFGFYIYLGRGNDLAQVGLISLVAFMQFLPGLLATLYWPGGSRRGFVLGLATGIIIWLLTMLLPLFIDINTLYNFGFGPNPWHQSAIYALAANVGVFVVVSMLFKPSPQELHAANSCALNALHRPQGAPLNISEMEDLVDLLAPRIGFEAAWREVRLALNDLQLDEDDCRPQDLSRLRDQLEINLSSLLGPVKAIVLLSPDGKSQEDSHHYRDKNIHVIEDHLEHYQNELTGLAAELDQLRRYHRLTLQRLPVGVFSLGRNRDILLWNTQMERYTGLENDEVIGQDITKLPSPWHQLLGDFAHQDQSHLHNQKVIIGGTPRWYTFHKAAIDDPSQGGSGSQVILVEDETETQRLSDKLIHNERLASIGRLAAGVAHEIGNPITGIACLAQNLRYETQNEVVLESGQQILEQTGRIDRIVKSLMNFAHSGDYGKLSDHTLFSIDECVTDAIRLVRLDARRKQVNYINLCDEKHLVLGDAQRLLQVFVNLLNNAADASEPGQSIRVTSSHNSESLIIEVIDEGSGIPPELQDCLFEPFFTTKEPGKGTGLGLSLVYSIIEEHYGTVQIESPINKEQNHGVRVLIKLPIPTQKQHLDPSS